MIRVRINVGKVGLVFRRGDYHRVITEGVHWVALFDEVVIYDRSMPFQPKGDGKANCELNILLRDAKLAQELEVADVKDHEIALKYEDGLFTKVLPPGQYAYWKGVKEYSFQKIDLSKIDITEPVDLSILNRHELAPYVQRFVVEPYERGVLYVDGRFEKMLAGGIYYLWKNAQKVNVDTVDMRQTQAEVPGQEILTKDKAAIRVNFLGNYQVVDVEKALVENKNFALQLYTAMQIALREFAGTYTLDELPGKKEQLSVFVPDTIKDKAATLGVKIIDCGVKDIVLPGDMKEIMNQVLMAEKQAQANVIMRREETASTRSLLNTAKLMEENEMLFKLKEMEYVEKIGEKVGEITVAGNGQMIDQLREIFTNR